ARRPSRVSGERREAPSGCDGVPARAPRRIRRREPTQLTREIAMQDVPADRSDPFISTGQLPPPETVTALVRDAHERFKSDSEAEFHHLPGPGQNAGGVVWHLRCRHDRECLPSRRRREIVL